MCDVCRVLCITNRLLCKEDFLSRIEMLAEARPKGIILREKDLSASEYKALAKAVLEICSRYDVICILHSFADIAIQLGAAALHLPLPVLRELPPNKRSSFTTLGASCHSIEEAKEAEALGCTYITAGHVFDTDCKKGLAGRGLEFLKQVCESVTVPVYGIGGISGENAAQVIKAGAKGVCVMSGAMLCGDPQEYLAKLREI
ncbi:MAG: thiamine phosphate synthase [Oscillospiraceae bacterium]|nr:thiamine phosphate synthase [Oscillospiraceae bacterium]